MDFLKWYAAFRQEVDVQVNCDHYHLVTNCKFNTLAFASIRCVLFIFWSWSSISLKEVIRTPFSGLFYPGGCIRIAIDIGFHCDHFLLVTNCKFNTLALIFASIRCVLFICWSLFSSAWKEVIRIPFNRLSYPGRAINVVIDVGFYVLNQ